MSKFIVVVPFKIQPGFEVLKEWILRIGVFSTDKQDATMYEYDGISKIGELERFISKSKYEKSDNAWRNFQYPGKVVFWQYR